jgi:indolepyruvate ferredoxin oxidoreductase beta subunit
MEYNLILAGVGGQGILTIAQAISVAVVRRGWHVKQAEVHGMSQRGGAVQSHLRFSDKEIFSDLVPMGKADMVLAVEPLEALRYVQYLAEHGSIVASTVPFVNIPDYPPVEQVLDQVSSYPNHVLIDAERIAKASGSARAVNTVMVGAASEFLGFDLPELEAAMAELFGKKGEKLVNINQTACRYGRSAAHAYKEGLQRGASPADVRQWMESVPPESLGKADGPEATDLAVAASNCELSRAEAHAVSQILDHAYHDNRRQLFEHEVYRLIEVVGAISPPRHYFVRKGEKLTAETLDRFPGEKVVLKVVSPEIVHKTEAGAVMFVPKELETVNREIQQMISRAADTACRIDGVLVVEKVEWSGSGFGQELFVGIRATREFGAIIAAGLGGVDTEYLATKMRPGVAVAKALAVDTSPEEFFELFKKTAAYDVLAGRARGRRRVVSDGELLRCFRAFIAVARRFMVDRGEEGPDLGELEVNPFAFVRQRMVPLDGRGQLATATPTPVARPLSKTQALLEPKSIAVIGVSTKRANFGRIILNNIQACGYAPEHLYVIREGEKEIDGIKCVPNVAALPEQLDLLVVATAAESVPGLMDEVIESRKVTSMVVIPGGMGETEGTQDLEAKVRQQIVDSRQRADEGPIVVGGNCMGIRSRPGHYDTFFIPEAKLDPRRDQPARRLALVSQSGAFVITRMSNVTTLDPRIAISLGNQLDLTVSDLLRAVGDREDIDCVGVYVEGFNDLDGLAFVRAVESVTASGKIVIFYKAGRTASGRAATAGHTASVAGDYDVCQAAVAQAGAVVTDSFKEFEQLLDIATSMHDKQVGGRRIAAMSNAGFETVGMADTLRGERYQIELPAFDDATTNALRATLAKFRLDGLVNARNPLDLTPMASDEAYEGCIRTVLAAENIDAVVVGAVPLSPQMLTTADEIGKPGSLIERIPAVLRDTDKPVVVVVDSGRPYDSYVEALQAAGVVVFRSSGQAVRTLGRYLCHRTERQQNGVTPKAAVPAPVPAEQVAS